MLLDASKIMDFSKISKNRITYIHYPYTEDKTLYLMIAKSQDTSDIKGNSSHLLPISCVSALNLFFSIALV